MMRKPERNLKKSKLQAALKVSENRLAQPEKKSSTIFLPPNIKIERCRN